nr:hypothetical protein [Tanacetum cinerariifolium]
TQLLLIAGPNHEIDHRGALQKPIERYLRHRFTSFGGYRVERVDYAKQQFVGHLGALATALRQAATIRNRLPPTNFTAEQARR